MSDCTTNPKILLCDPMVPMPKTIKETGFFPSAPDFAKRPSVMREYVPSPALWSDGMEKQRFLVLPSGKKIDNADPKRWEFPIGTLFIKTFFDDTGANGARRPIETRFIRRAGGDTDLISYDYYLYKWNPQGTDAELVLDDLNGDMKAAPTVPITIKHMVDGQMLTVNNGQSFQHTLPSRQMCGECHQENGQFRQTFIGFDEMRLNSKLTPTSAKTQLQEFADAGLFMAPPRSNPETITDSNPLLLRIKQHVFGNCVHCHNGGKVVDLAPDVFVANTVKKATEGQSVKPPAGWLRVVPQSPNTSVLYVQMERTMIPPPASGGDMNRLRPMPPDGVAMVAADQAALKDVRDWIMSLPK